MKNEIPERFLKNVVMRPDNLSNRYKSQIYEDLKVTLDLLDAEKAVILTEEEAIALFGKCFQQTIKIHMKKRGLKKVKIAKQKERIYIWNTKV